MTVRSSSSTSIANGSGNTITGTAPSGVSAADRGYVWIVQDTDTIFTPPSGEGWASISGKMHNTGPDGQSAELFEKKVLTGTETYAFTSNASSRAIIQVVALTGRHASDSAIISTPVVDNNANATPVSVNVTGLTALANDDLLVFYQLDQSAQTDVWSFTPPGGYTGLQNVANSDWITAGCAKKENVSAGATGTLTATATRSSGSGSAGFSGVIVSVPAAGGTPSLTVSTPSAVAAGSSGSSVFTFTLSASSGSATGCTLSLADVTAYSGTDYTGTLTSGMFSNGVTVSAGVISIPAGVTSFTLSVPIT